MGACVSSHQQVASSAAPPSAAAEALLRLHQKADTRLRQAMEGWQEGIALLDLCHPGWRMVHCNDAFRAAAGLLPPSIAGTPCGSCIGAEEDGPMDFWSMFGNVNSNPGLHKAALVAIETGKEFTLAVRPTAAVATNSTGQASVVRVLFKPADGDQPPACSLPICVDALTGALPGQGLPSGDFPGSCNSSCSDKSGGPASGCKHQFFFAIVQAPDSVQRPNGLTRSNSASSSMHSWLASTADPGRGEGSALGGSTNVSQTLLTQCDSSGVLSTFFEAKPEVMQEVQLGPLIGAGSSGRCYKAQWQGGRVAVKIIDCKVEPEGGVGADLNPWDASGLDDELGSQKPAADAALVEALLARSLSHPHILTTFCHAVSDKLVHECGEWHQQVWIIQEFCSRGSLLGAIDNGMFKLPNGSHNLPAVLLSAQEIAGACLYLHRHGIVHGDLTPGNVMLKSSSLDNRDWVCKVGDFGLAQIINSDDPAGIYSSCYGTLTHAAPELVLEGALTKAVDVFSFGVILLEMYNNKRVWRGYSFMQIMAAIGKGNHPFVIPTSCPKALALLLRRCLHTDTTQRPTFDVVLAELQALLDTMQRSFCSPAPQPTSVSVQGPSFSAGEQAPPKHISPFAQQQQHQATTGTLGTIAEQHTQISLDSHRSAEW